MPSHRSQKINQDALAISLICGFICAVTAYYVIPAEPLFEWILIASGLLIVASLSWVRRQSSPVRETSHLSSPYLSASPLFLLLALVVIREVLLPDVSSMSFAVLVGISISLSVWATISLDRDSQSEQLLPVAVGKTSLSVALFCLTQFIFDTATDQLVRAVLIGAVTYSLTEIYFHHLNWPPHWRFSGGLTGAVGAQISLFSYFLPYSSFDNGILTFSVIYLCIAILENSGNKDQQSSILFCQVLGVILLVIWSLS